MWVRRRVKPVLTVDGGERCKYTRQCDNTIQYNNTIQVNNTRKKTASRQGGEENENN